MALGDNIKKSAEEFKKLNRVGEEFKSNLNDITSQLQEQAKVGGDLSGAIQEASSNLGRYRNLADQLSGISKETLKDKKEIQKIDKKIYDISQRQLRIQSKIKELNDKKENASKKEAAAIEKSIELLQDAGYELSQLKKGYEKIAEESEKLSKSNPFKGVADLISDIPILNKLLSNMVTAADKYNEVLVDTENRNKALLAGTKEYFKLLGKASLVFVLSETKKAITSIDQLSVQLASNLAISKNEAIGLTQQFSDQAKQLQGMSMTYVKIMEANIQLASLQKVQTTFSKETSMTFSILTKNLGISAESVSKLDELFRATGSNLKDQVTSTMGMVKLNNKNFNIAISEKEVMQEIANISTNVALSMSAQGKNLAEAVYQAQKLGLSMQQVEKTAASLLDFESSITNELEAELLIGKDLNLERARLAALNNNMKKVAEEMGRQGITQSAFAGMNAIQQASIAKSLGMTAGEMGDMFKRQESLRRLGAEKDTDVDKIIMEMRANGATREQIEKRIGNDRLLEASQNRIMQDQIRDLIHNLHTLVMPFFVKVLEKLNKLLNYLANTSQGTKIAAGTVAGTMGLGLASSLMGGVGMMGMVRRFMPGRSSAGSGGRMFNPVTMFRDKAGRAQYNRIGRSMGKTPGFVPGVKAASGTAKFGTRLVKGLRGGAVGLLGGLALDYGADAAKEAGMENLGKGLSIGSSALSGAGMGAMIGSIIPGVGTAIGGAVGGIVGGIYGAYQEFKDNGEEQLAEQKKQTEILAKSQELMEKQTEELFQAIRESGIIELDGTKMANVGLVSQQNNYQTQ